MSLKFRCPKCEKKLAVPEKLAGKAIRCPNCQTAVRTPKLPKPSDDESSERPPKPVADTPEPEPQPTDPLAATSAIPPGTLDDIFDDEPDNGTPEGSVPPPADEEPRQEENPSQNNEPPAADPLAATSAIPAGTLDDILDGDDEPAAASVLDEPPADDPTGDSDLIAAAVGPSAAQVEEDSRAVRRRIEEVRRYEEATAEAEPDKLVLSSRLDDEEDDLDMTPMVDVTFLLLIFFMITASFTVAKTMPTAPPQPDAAAAAAAAMEPEEEEQEPVLIEIYNDNSVYVEGKKTAIGSALVDALSQQRVRERRREVMLELEPEASHGTVVAVNDAAIRAGMESVKRKVRD